MRRVHARTERHSGRASGAEIDLVRETTNKNWVIGNQHLKRQIEELAGRSKDLIMSASAFLS